MNQRFVPKLFTALLLANLWSLPGFAQDADAVQQIYEQGQNALRQGNWDRAIAAFTEVVASGSVQADAALYWQAHAYYQSGRNRPAQRALQELRERYPKSAWIDDAQALAVQHGAVKSASEIGALEENELRLYALAVLMDKHPSRALPLAQKMLSESSDAEVREQVLFIIGTSDSPSARQIIRDVAFNGTLPELREHAIYLLANEGNKEDIDALFQLYSQLRDQESKETIIFALANQEQEAYVTKILAQEQNPELQASAIHALANMGAVQAIQQLDLAALSPEARRAAVYAFAETSEIEPAQVQHLLRIYRETTDNELKESVLYALGNAEQSQFLLSLLETEQNDELQASAIYALSNMEAHDQLAKLDLQRLGQNGREALVHAYAEAGNVEQLKQLLRDEKGREIRATIIYQLADMDETQIPASEITPILLQVYHQGTDVSDREAVIHAFMQRSATKELLQLMREENDKEMRSAILHALADSDDPEAQEYLFQLLEQ